MENQQNILDEVWEDTFVEETLFFYQNYKDIEERQEKMAFKETITYAFDVLLNFDKCQ